MSSVVSNIVNVLYSAGDYSVACARQVSSVLLADSSLAFSATGATRVWSVESKLGSRLKLVPLILFLLSTSLFW